jgi:hypothetical protein
MKGEALYGFKVDRPPTAGYSFWHWNIRQPYFWERNPCASCGKIEHGVANWLTLHLSAIEQFAFFLRRLRHECIVPTTSQLELGGDSDELFRREQK